KSSEIVEAWDSQAKLYAQGTITVSLQNACGTARRRCRKRRTRVRCHRLWCRFRRRQFFRPLGASGSSSVRRAAPRDSRSRARAKCPADLDFAAGLIVAEVSRRSDDLPVGSVVDDESPSTLHRFTEEVAKHFLLVAIACRVLLPDEWVLRDREQCFEIVGAQ